MPELDGEGVVADRPDELRLRVDDRDGDESLGEARRIVADLNPPVVAHGSDDDLHRSCAHEI